MASERGGSRGGMRSNFTENGGYREKWDGAARNQERGAVDARNQSIVEQRGRRGVAGEAAAAEAWSPLAAGELFHHEAGAAARDMGDDGRATMNFRDQS